MRTECWIECVIECRGLNQSSPRLRNASLQLIDPALDSAL